MKNGIRTFRARLKEDLRSPEFRKAFDEANIPARLAVQIARIRERQGLTQSRLARKIGVSQQALSQFENPARARYTLRTLQRIATALKRQLVVEIR